MRSYIEAHGRDAYQRLIDSAKVWYDAQSRAVEAQRQVVGAGRKLLRTKYIDMALYNGAGAPVVTVGKGEAAADAGTTEIVVTAEHQPPTKIQPSVDEYIRRGYSGGVTRVMNTA